MRLFHVSEEENIEIFEPRLPNRNDLFSELLKRNVEIRVVDNLWNIADEVKMSTLNWSLCRMGNAQPRGAE